LDAAVDTFVRTSGAERVLLMNRSGRLLIQRGFPDANEVVKVATLAAGIHATGRRIGMLVGDEQMAQAHNKGRSREFMLSELWTPAGPILVLTVFLPSERLPEARAAFEEFARRLGSLSGMGPQGVTAEEFEASLNDSLDRLFPRDR
jgi:hypothetical protein